MSFVFNVYPYIHVFGHMLYLTLYSHFHVVLDWTLNLEHFEFESSSSQAKELGGLWTASERNSALEANDMKGVPIGLVT